MSQSCPSGIPALSAGGPGTSDPAPPRVLIDGSPFTNDYQKGIARYLAELVRNSRWNCTLLVDAPVRVAVPGNAAVLARPERFPTSRRAVALWLWRRAQREFLPTRVDASALWHSTYYEPAPHPGMTSVVTVHDLIAEIYPHHHSVAEREVARRRDCIAHARAIVAISQATADALRAVYPEAADRVTVIHHGADHLVPPRHDEPGDSRERPFALFVGHRGEYKNWLTVVDALASARWPRDLPLHVVGRPLGGAEQAALRFRGVADRVAQLGVLDDAELSAAYRRASVFVFPSLMEGFGFPLLEAQAHGTPVAASDIPVFREVGGDAFVPFQPLDPDSIADAVATAIEPVQAARLRAAGLANVKRFTWAECARKTEAVWQAAWQSAARSSLSIAR